MVTSILVISLESADFQDQDFKIWLAPYDTNTQLFLLFQSPG